MPISVVCPKCSAKLNAPDAAAGRNVRCPKCQAGIAVPAPMPPDGGAAFEVVDEPQPAKQPAAAKPAARPVVKAQVEDDEDDEQPKKKRAKAVVDEDDEEDAQPRKKKKKKQSDDEGKSMMVRNIIGGIVLVILLGVAGWVFYDKRGKKDEDTAGSSSSGGGESTPANPRMTGGMPGMPVGPVGNRGERLGEIFRQARDSYVATRKAMEAVTDGPTGQALAKQLGAATQQLQQYTEELKTMGNLTPAEALRGLPPADWVETGQGLQAAGKKLEGVLKSGRLPTDAVTAVGQAALAWAQANLAFSEALKAIAPKKG